MYSGEGACRLVRLLGEAGVRVTRWLYIFSTQAPEYDTTQWRQEQDRVRAAVRQAGHTAHVRHVHNKQQTWNIKY